MARITIVYFLTSAVHGGVEEHVLAHLEHLDPGRFATVLACPSQLIEAFGDGLRKTPAEVFPVELSGLSRGDLGNAWRFYRYLRRRRPDIVNCHMFRATLLGAPLAKLAGVPRVIATFHGREPWRHGFIKGSFVLDRLADRAVDRMIAVCQSSKDYLVRTKGLDPRKITVIHNGRDLSTYKPIPETRASKVRQQLGIGPRHLVVGVVGRLDHQKGHRYLLEAMPEVLRHRSETRLLVVGEGSLLISLQDQAARLRLLSKVIFTGFRRDVPELMAAMDVVVLPSLYEGLPLTLIEAMAMARPVVATAVDGTLDLIEDGVSGLLVPPADPIALARAILHLLDDPDTARRLAEAGRRSVLERFDVRLQIEATARLYEECLGRKELAWTSR